MRDTIFELFDKKGSFTIDREADDMYHIGVDDGMEYAGWTLDAGKMRQIADFIMYDLNNMDDDYVNSARVGMMPDSGRVKDKHNAPRAARREKVKDE